VVLLKNLNFNLTVSVLEYITAKEKVLNYTLPEDEFVLIGFGLIRADTGELDMIYEYDNWYVVGSFTPDKPPEKETEKIFDIPTVAVSLPSVGETSITLHALAWVAPSQTVHFTAYAPEYRIHGIRVDSWDNIMASAFVTRIFYNVLTVTM